MTFAYVGSYTSKPRNGRGAGITVYGVDSGSGGNLATWPDTERMMK